MKEKIFSILILAGIFTVIGFFIGRSSRTEQVRYVKEKPKTGSVISIPNPEIETQEIKPILPYKYIFLTDTFYQVVDTAEIIKDYSLNRGYSFTLFDDTFGKLDLKPTLQYNKLKSLDYVFMPITKEVIKKDIFDIFATIGYATNETALLGGGLFYKKIGVEYNYNIRLRKNDHLNNNYHTFKLHYKF